MERKQNKKNLTSKLLQCLAIAIALLIVVAVFFSDIDFLSIGKSDSTQNINTFEEYVFNLENKIENTISNIDGVGKVSVSITFDSGIEKTYAYETIKETSNGVISEELILYKGEPIVINEIMPSIKGVVVVAKGASNAVVRLNIIRTIQILLGVTYDKIEVFTFKT